MEMLNCRHFNGYKPCGLSDSCSSQCPHYDLIDHRLLIVHLEALGAVLRATSILPALRRKYPRAHITWITQAPAHHLLAHNPLIDRILTTATEDILALSSLSFDAAFVIDKSLKATGVVQRCARVNQVYGFKVDGQNGVIVPATHSALELWQLGLSNHRKFHINQKPETQLVIEALELGPFQRDPYVLHLTPEEREEMMERRRRWAPRGDVIIGINTGCSSVIPYKKLSVPYHRHLIRELEKLGGVRVVLLGGPEDTIRNQHIGAGLNVVYTPTERGLRDGLVSVAACDVVITGDSLGMHMAIALEKWVVAWFGPTCSQEIDLYDRGEKVKTQAQCSPCWKRHCAQETMCYDLVPMDEIVNAVKRGVDWTISSSKQPFSETSFSPSP